MVDCCFNSSLKNEEVNICIYINIRNVHHHLSCRTYNSCMDNEFVNFGKFILFLIVRWHEIIVAF